MRIAGIAAGIIAVAVMGAGMTPASASESSISESSAVSMSAQWRCDYKGVRVRAFRGSCQDVRILLENWFDYPRGGGADQDVNTGYWWIWGMDHSRYRCREKGGSAKLTPKYSRYVCKQQTNSGRWVRYYRIRWLISYD